MKRIKAMNGYTIYQLTERDEKNGNGTAGNYNIYFSSDVRDFGVSYSTPEYDDIDSLEIATELCGGNFAIAKEIAEETTTAATYEEIVEIEKKLDVITAAGVNNISQDEAQEIIKGVYGAAAYAIGHSITENAITIYWIYIGETEDDYRTFTI